MISQANMKTRDIRISRLQLPGTLILPEGASSLVIFAHGSGSSRHSPRNQLVARALNERGFATLLFDLLTPTEEQDRANVFDIPLLADRLIEALEWAEAEAETRALRFGLFGASTGAGAALAAAAEIGERIGAIVSRGGRPDLAGAALRRVTVPTLLIVGGADHLVVELNEVALDQLRGPRAMVIVPGATHLFPEPGALETVIAHAGEWFDRYLRGGAPEYPVAAPVK
jgi:putative phosphoribosyl transferase